MYSSSIAHIIKEAKIRFWWMVFCFFITFATCYYFSEDLFFALATPYFKVSKTSFFICTQITESLNTYITISIILGLIFSAPFIFYQVWCFFLPSWNKSQRQLSNKIVIFSLASFLFILYGTFVWILPSIWLFLYKLSNTGTESHFFIIQLQPKIYDFSLLTLRVLFIAGLCSQIPIGIFCSIQYKIISMETCLKNRRILWFTSILFAALITPPDVWCQLSAWFSIVALIELTLFTVIIQSSAHDSEFQTVRTIQRNRKKYARPASGF
jgi:Tat protein translocase TatC